ncbi:MAG TPA: Coagulation factor 5/8 type domain-containing protein, partial [Solirubrobacteraceae bacterium]|nr:Coagulation factor 5/8 type domain-containing protein [Solirubrobacteraceae bacterium]
MCLLAATLLACALVVAPPASALTPDARYELANGCYGLKSESPNRLVATDSGPFRMQATDLGRYLLYGRKRDFLTGDAQNRVAAAAEPSENADWRVDVAGEAFKLVLPSRDRALAANAAGELVLVDPAGAGRFTFERAQGCPEYPEVELNVTGDPFPGPQAYGEVRGFLETHMHWMGFRLSGGGIHCGRPWHRYGAPYALVDCPDHYPVGEGAIVENAANAGRGSPTHDPVGWPTFKDWPNPRSLTHEQAYYKWIERAWRSGLRLFVNKAAENGALCEVYPIKYHSCREMDGALMQIRDLYDLQDYVDAQNGGPGKGWFRIVRDPFQARRVINQGKMAVVLGIEVSRLFDCRILNDVPQCTKTMIDHQLDGVYRLGVRDMQVINKFDNAFGGVAGDDGSNGVVTTNGHLYETRRFPEFRTCTGPDEDRPQIQAVGGGRDQLLSNAFSALLPGGGIAPVYPPPPHCNARGLTELGAYIAGRMMERRMIIDPDHLSVLARSQLLSILEAHRYSGTMSSHSWADYTSYRRIMRLGGVIGPASGPTAHPEFMVAWRKVRELRDPRFYAGMGFGADMRGLAPQPGARTQGGNPVQYPFKSFDGGVTIDRQRSGQRVFDVNRDGVAHYGLYPDWIEDQRRQVGD